MASHSKPRIESYRASGAIAKGKAVMFGSDDETVVQCSAVSDPAIGIAQNTLSADDASNGVPCEVALPGGGGKALLADTVVRGDRLGINASGALQKVASQGDMQVAQAKASGVVGDIIGVEVQIPAPAYAAQA